MGRYYLYVRYSLLHPRGTNCKSRIYNLFNIIQRLSFRHIFTSSAAAHKHLHVTVEGVLQTHGNGGKVSIK